MLDCMMEEKQDIRPSASGIHKIIKVYVDEAPERPNDTRSNGKVGQKAEFENQYALQSV